MYTVTDQRRRFQDAAADERPSVPLRVCELLADHRLGTQQSGPQGSDYYQVVAVA